MQLFFPILERVPKVVMFIITLFLTAAIKENPKQDLNIKEKKKK